MKNNTWKTTDFNSAIILRSIDTPLIGLTYLDNQICFNFNANPDYCQTKIAEHWDGKLYVESRKFLETIKELKTRLYQLKQNHDKH